MAVGILCIPKTRSSLVMATLRDRGYELGDVRGLEDEKEPKRYPQGRLELLSLLDLNLKPLSRFYPKTKDVDLSGVDVVKVFPAWFHTVEGQIDRWVALYRNGKGRAVQWPCEIDYAIDDARDFDIEAVMNGT